MAAVVRTQMRAAGAHQGLSPVLDVTRDPRWGRVEETFGEDPYLVSQMGVHFVRGLHHFMSVLLGERCVLRPCCHCRCTSLYIRQPR